MGKRWQFTLKTVYNIGKKKLHALKFKQTIFSVKLSNPIIYCEHFQSISDLHQIVEATEEICCGSSVNVKHRWRQVCAPCDFRLLF